MLIAALLQRGIAANIILSWLIENHIFSIGRYGKWTYLSMEDCILSAVKLAQEI